MFNKTKYITFEGQNTEDILIFGGTTTHAEIARCMGLREGDVLGAGFMDVYVDASGNPRATCYGKSVSLDVECRDTEDSWLAEMALGLK